VEHLPQMAVGIGEAALIRAVLLHRLARGRSARLQRPDGQLTHPLPAVYLERNDRLGDSAGVERARSCTGRLTKIFVDIAAFLLWVARFRRSRELVSSRRRRGERRAP
jgi:hypothetical protein